jgi:UDP-glucose 4-epimerase
VLKECGPFDVVYHLAARVGVRAVLEDPEAARRVNEEATLGLLGALRMVPPGERPRLFAASSSEVYRDSSAVLAEGAAVRRVDGVGRWAYAASKLCGERLLDEARGLWPRGRGPVHLRFFNVVGPGQDSAAGFVLPRFVEAARAGRALTVYGDGSSVRTYAHVDEVVRTLARLGGHPAVPEGALNVGGVARASVLELARAVAAVSGGAGRLRRVDPRAELGSGFEEVRVRLPALGRLEALGCGVPSMELGAIVADTFERHVGRELDVAAEGSCASRAS